MRRIALTDGRWFDADKSERFAERTFFDGESLRSRATGECFVHEELYRTAQGRWIRHRWSTWLGRIDEWTEVSAQDAARWLIKNGDDPHLACASEYASLEVP